MNMKTIAAVAAIIIVLGAGYVVARPSYGGFRNGMMAGYGNVAGYGMMGSGYGNGYTGGMMDGGMMGSGAGDGKGMMGGYGNASGMMGSGYGNGYTGGMMGGGMMGYGASYGNGSYGCGGYAGVNSTSITIEDAKKAVEQHLTASGNIDLKLSEVMEFENNFYAGVKEKSTDKYAFELLVNKYTGAVMPEMGPNMMWNTKYGHMGWNTQAQANVTEKQALVLAQSYLDRALPGTKVSDADAFYGYYTIEVTKDGKIYGMLSVNSYTGAVWYHTWHGGFLRILEVE
ncbi:MAG: hypothetical protein O8C66_01385 [Candidatus Methanoperedens sp.]|nr:hypothetical protein [Candidatus Methanoperedens sp.]MCZ7369141.1 hypothetical protein [Candidatus Methanoperedens sp.]